MWICGYIFVCIFVCGCVYTPAHHYSPFLPLSLSHTHTKHTRSILDCPNRAKWAENNTGMMKATFKVPTIAEVFNTADFRQEPFQTSTDSIGYVCRVGGCDGVGVPLFVCVGVMCERGGYVWRMRVCRGCVEKCTTPSISKRNLPLSFPNAPPPPVISNPEFPGPLSWTLMA